MLNCTSLIHSGCYFNTSQESLSTCWNAGGSVQRVLGCADGPKFFCSGNESAISNEADTANIPTVCPIISTSQSSSVTSRKVSKCGILKVAMLGLALAGVALAQVDGPTFSDLTNTDYGNQSADLTSFFSRAGTGDVWC